MIHARQQIFTYVADLLKATAAKVEIQTPFDVERKHATHIDINFNTDAIDLERKTMDSDAFEMDMVVTITATGDALESAGPKADAVALLVQQALSAEKEDINGDKVRDGVHTISGVSVDIDINSTDNEYSDEQEASTTTLDLQFITFYRTEPGNPAVLV